MDETQTFVRLVTAVLSPAPTSQVIERIVRIATESIDGCDHAGLCGVYLPSAPSPAQSELEPGLEHGPDGRGPCADALAGADLVCSDDLWDDERWPRLTPRTTRVGARSALAVRLFAGDETLGVLHLTGRRPGAFGPAARAQALLFAAAAGLALSAARSHAADERRVEQFRTAMLTREIIGQAQGILMERERVRAEQAFALIRDASQRLNVKLRDVAQELVDTGLLPTGMEPAGRRGPT